MRKVGRIGLFLSVMLAIALLMNGWAMADVDLGRSGSVAVRIHTADGVNVKGARIGLYRVGEAAIENSNLKFELTGSFAGCGVSLADLSDSGMAAELAVSTSLS